ncbi:MAG TPA: VOC family protein [Thermoanaerobaculia bacterium]|nr:VOC family protein [Thermoanaerobaculia bacterium]
MTDRKALPGKFVWYELVTSDAKKAQAFYRKVLGWKTQPFPMGDYTYEMILAGDTPDSMIGGYALPTKNDRRPSHWIAYVSVEDVDAAVKTATANGGKVLAPPSDIPDVGRTAGIADPQGAELHLLENAKGDPPDISTAPPGRFFWNELHTRDTAKALAFYEKVVGFTHRAMDMGPGGVYNVISKGGVDRGGVTTHLPPDMQPHWLPYVAVEDPDETLGLVKKSGGTIHMPAEDIPGVGRFGVLQDPTGAFLAVMKPMPNEKMKEMHEKSGAKSRESEPAGVSR